MFFVIYPRRELRRRMRQVGALGSCRIAGLRPVGALARVA
jgi:hypothetical protein